MKLYRVQFATSIPANGVNEWTDHGTAVAYEGEQYVQFSYGPTLTKRTGDWHDTLAKARRAAAEKLDAMSSALQSQARRLRCEADLEELQANAPAGTVHQPAGNRSQWD